MGRCILLAVVTLSISRHCDIMRERLLATPLTASITVIIAFSCTGTRGCGRM